MTKDQKPIHFSEYFKVKKGTLKDSGVFDPILNYDTKVFVDSFLLKSSQSLIIQRGYDTYKEFFGNI